MMLGVGFKRNTGGREGGGRAGHLLRVEHKQEWP